MMIKTDYSIEYAHIYTSHEIGKEHREALSRLERATRRFAEEGKSYNLVVLVDDYSFPDENFSYGDFMDWLKQHGFKPDVMIRESQLIPVCDQVIELVQEPKLKKRLAIYVQTKQKYPCSLFVAAWYLVRLGKLSMTEFDKALCSRSILNILPKSYIPFEEQGLRIISSTEYSDQVQNIEYEYIEGRQLESEDD